MKQLDVFVDVVILRSGDFVGRKVIRRIRRSEVFIFYTWCRHAKASPWLDKEWRYALARRGLGFIDPIPLESPEKAPSPERTECERFQLPDSPALSLLASRMIAQVD
jgi:hypothetical protein